MNFEDNPSMCDGMSTCSGYDNRDNDDTSVYRMDPAVDVVLLSDELCAGMLVIQEDPFHRSGLITHSADRTKKFRRIVRPPVLDSDAGGVNCTVSFVGEWDDGYQEGHTMYGAGFPWIVKKDSITADE